MEQRKPLPADELVGLVEHYADEMKAERIERIYVREKTSVSDYFVVCTGTSDVHVRSIAEKVAENLRQHGVRMLRQEESREWVLQDYGDVVFHVMLEDKRQFYDLEALWRGMQNDPNLVR